MKKLFSPQGLIRRMVPPYFPESHLLQKYWWHRLALLLAIIVSASSFYAVVFMGIIFILGDRIWLLFGSNSFGSMLFYLFILPTYIPSFIAQPIIPGLQSAAIGAEDSELSGIVYILLLFAIAFLPTVAYRLILFTSFGSKWKK